MTKAKDNKRDLKAARRVVLTPNAFQDTYHAKPTTEVAVGLRLVGQIDTDRARLEAEREAIGFLENLGDARDRADDRTLDEVYNDAFMARMVAYGTCDPNNVLSPYFTFAAEDVVQLALTPEGIRRCWDELLLLHKGASPARPRASDNEVQRFSRILRNGVPLDDESRMMIAYLLDKHPGVDPGVRREDGAEDEDDDVAVYTAKVA